MIKFTLQQIKKHFSKYDYSSYDYVYGIPKNGLIVSLAVIPLRQILSIDELLEKLREKNNVLIIDDIKDSGRTERKMLAIIKGYEDQCKFIYFLDKQQDKVTDWISFPWEDWEEKVKDEEDLLLRKQQYAEK